MQVVSRFMAFPTWARVAAVAAGAVIVIGAVSIPVAAVAVDEHHRQLSLEIAAKEAAAEKEAAAKAAEALAGASRDALAQAVADLATADDVAAALARVRAASDVVVAAQNAALSAAETAAKQEAEAEANASNGGGSPGGAPPDGSVSIGHFPDPGIIGMYPGERASCGENPTGQVVTLDFGWDAREGNTVDIFYALTDGDYLATGGFMLLASGRGSSGSVSIPVTCPVGPGPTSYVTVKAVAINENGSAAAHYWGL